MNDKQDKILISKVLDKYNKYVKTNTSTYTTFLNVRSFNIIKRYLDKNRIKYDVYPKEEYLEKKIICFGPYNNFVTYYKADINNDIKHSDILGTLFGKGLKEDFIGDIIVEDGYFYISSLIDSEATIKEDLSLVKNYPIKLKKIDNIILNKEHYETRNLLVSSNRIDSVVSKIVNNSRSFANDLIKNKLVLLNYEEVSSSSNVNVDDIISIRKYGKYKIGNIVSTTKKGKIVLECKKYV